MDNSAEPTLLARNSEALPDLRDTKKVVVRPRRRMKRLAILLGVVGIVTACGIWGWGKFHKPSKQPEITPTLENAETTPATENHGNAPEQPPATGDGLSKIDDRIRAEEFPKALALCLAHPEAKTGANSFKIRYRVALCREALRETAEALELFHELAEHKHDSAPGIAAQLGQARCQVTLGLRIEARQGLSHLLLNSNRPDMRQKPFLPELYSILAELELLGLPPSPTVHALHPTGVAEVKRLPNIARYLDWIDGPESPQHPAEAKEFIKVERGKRGYDQHQVSAAVHSMSLLKFLREIGEQGGLLTWIPIEMEARFSDKTATVAIDRLPLREVLSALLEPHSIDWSIEAGALVLAPHTVGAVDYEDREDRVRKALRRALAAGADPGHAVGLRLALANLDFHQGKYREALESYQRLIQESPHAPQSLPISYNRALAHLRLSEFTQAREQCLDVIDRATTPRWRSLGWWWIARTYLDSGAFEQATPALKKALRYSENTDVKPVVLLAMSTVSLLQGKPNEAQDSLRADRKTLLGKTYRNDAAFLDTMARYRFAKAKQKLARRESEELVQAITGLRAELPVGPAEVILLGQACLDLGLQELMLPQYQKCLEYLRGPLAKQLTFELADYERIHGLTHSAREKYLALAAVDTGDWGNRARLQLADFALQDGKLNDCIRTCLPILHGESRFRDDALRRVGVALQQQGRHALAAECFAGRIPNVVETR